MDERNHGATDRRFLRVDSRDRRPDRSHSRNDSCPTPDNRLSLQNAQYTISDNDTAQVLKRDSRLRHKRQRLLNTRSTVPLYSEYVDSE